MSLLVELLYQFFVIFLILVSLPLFLIISLCIVISSGFPVIFQQTRIGKNGKPFILYKFRTMYKDADKHQDRLRTKNEAKGPVFKIREDPRFTPFGAFLSHVGLDELPQLLNVLKGEVALFGPRPLPPQEVKKLITWQKKRHQIKPGIVSPWILTGYHNQPFDQWMRSDIEYIKNKSLYYDFWLLIKIVKFMGKLWFYELKEISRKINR